MARKAATLGELQELHSLIAKSLNKRITQDMEDEIPHRCGNAKPACQTVVRPDAGRDVHHAIRPAHRSRTDCAG